MRWLKAPRWSPYVVGAGIGLLSWFTFLSADSPLGTSTTFVRAMAFAEKAVAPEHVAENPYFKKTGPKIDWQFALVVGLFIGAFVSSRLSGDRLDERVPELWERRFGPSVRLRAAGAFLGGLLLLFGARLADGCTSGHGISGALQLALSSWVFFLTLFAAGVATAWILFGKERVHV